MARAGTTTEFHEDKLSHQLDTRRHGEGRYIAHKVTVPSGDHVTVYVNSGGALSIDVGTHTQVRLRHGAGEVLHFGAGAPPLVPQEVQLD